jgi:hypothetical protein
MTIGQQLYDVLESDDGTCEMQTWEVRTIRKVRITAILINQWTWKKLSIHHGDYGWAPIIDPLWRRTWIDGDCPFHLTKKAAWKALLKQAEAGTLYIDDRFAVDRIIATAKAQIKKS